MDPLERARRYRVKADRASGLGADIEALRRAVRRRSGAEEAAQRAWEAVRPGGVDGVAVVGLRRGVLELRAPDAGVRYRLDRWLRSGGERRLLVEARAPIAGVRVVV